MDQDQTNQGSPLESGTENELKELRKNYNQISGELNAIKTSIEKRKSETTTLKILFYTALAVLLFGFIYTNQTLQRAQHNNLEANIAALKSRANQNLLSLERKLRQEILENKFQEILENGRRIQIMAVLLETSVGDVVVYLYVS